MSFSERCVFQLDGRVQVQDDATPIFFPDSRDPMIKVSDDISFAFELYWEKKLVHQVQCS